MIRFYLFFFLLTTIAFGVYYATVVWNHGAMVERVFASAGVCVCLVCLVLTIVVYQERK